MGELVLVATPIGNISDVSARAVETLQRADVVCCEDTRHSGQLLARLGVRATRLLSLHEHNEQERVREVLSLLGEGKMVAVVTDAGMPAVSDPGTRVVAAAHQGGYRVSAVPGPSAAIVAVAVSGFGTGGRFCFEGFCPRKGRERHERIAEMAASKVPVVAYEAPGRVLALLGDLAAACGPQRLVTICRELTKLHEEVWRGTLEEALAHFSDRVRGEFVIVLDATSPGERQVPTPAELREMVAGLVSGGQSRRDAVAETAERTGLARRQVYDALGREPTGPHTGGL